MAISLDLAAALAGAGAWSVHTAFAGAAPDLATLSAQGPGTSAHQQLLDTMVVTGAMAAAVGGLLSWAAGSVIPLVVALGTFGLLAVLHWSILMRTPPPPS